MNEKGADPVASSSQVSPNEKGATNYFKCKFCQKFCFSQKEVSEHELIHTFNKKLACRICGMGFARRSYLAEHMVIHAGLQPHKCLYCPKLFSLRCNLVRHLRIHTGERPFKCDHCGQSFILKKNMIEHERTHTGERPYQCPECDNVFSRRSSLVRHARTHTGERTFQCYDCNKKFSWKYYLRRHVATHFKEKSTRRRRTKLEIEQEKAAKSEKKLMNPIIKLPHIKVEECEEGPCKVFLPSSSTDAYEYEGIENIKEEVGVDEVEFVPLKIKEEVIDVDEYPEDRSERVNQGSTKTDVVMVNGYKVSLKNYASINKKTLIVDIPQVGNRGRRTALEGKYIQIA